MPNPPLDPDVADAAPADAKLTAYDHKHVLTELPLPIWDQLAAACRADTHVLHAKAGS
jgi:hypothetical protein